MTLAPLTPLVVNTQRHAWHGGWFEVATATPHPMVAPWVHGAYSGWVESTTHVVSRVEVAATIVPLIINFGEPYELVSGTSDTGATNGSPDVRRSFVAGLYDTWVNVRSARTSCAMQVNLTPFGARLLFGHDASVLTSRSVGVEDVLGAHGAVLIEQLSNDDTWGARFARLEHFLRDRFTRALALRTDVIPAPMRASWQMIQQRHGNVPISELRAQTGWSAKQLIAAFRQHVGLPPKVIARIVRFERVVQQIARAESSADAQAWARRALDSGYCDQSHLIRDFAQFAGTSPASFIRHRLPEGGGVLHADG